MKNKIKKNNKMMALMTAVLIGLAFFQVVIAIFQVMLILFKLK